MNKAIISIFLSALVLLMISSHDTYASHRHSVVVEPPREIAHTDGIINVSDTKGKRVNVTFWSSEDAASRLENIQKTIEARLDTTQVHIGVNLDDEPEVYREYLKRDNLHTDSNQYLADDAVAHSLTETYGYGTLYY